MRVSAGLEGVPRHPRGRAASVGVFDGVHLGHRRILARLVEYAREMRLEAAAITFEPHPMAVLRPDRVPPLLTSAAERLALLAACGVEHTIVLPFTAEVSRLGPRDFVADVLLRRLQVAAIFEGPNFTFGHRGAGDMGLMAELGRAHSFHVEVLPPVVLPQGVVSSSLARELLARGDVAAAAACLGRPYRLTGTVVAGDRRGKAIGFPTANLAYPADRAVPGRGVYAVTAAIGVSAPGGVSRHRLGGMANVGVRPTFPGRPQALEVHLFDWSGDLYGQTLSVDFIARLRDEQKFPGVAELVAQLHRDKAAALEALAAGDAGG